jgi:phosphomethylpyrimidine synthase
MATQRQKALAKNITNEMRLVARDESRSPEEIRQGLEKGEIVLIKNPIHGKARPVGVGRGLSTKVNANIGTSAFCSSIKSELAKLKVCVSSKAHTVMDLSTGGDLNKIRREIIKHSPLPVGTVPVYQAALLSEKKYGSFDRMTADDLFDAVELHAKDGVDFMTVHCGVNLDSVSTLKKNPRLMGVVSRGGAMLIRWMIRNNKENPLFEDFDRLLCIAEKYDVVLSLGDGMRPGSVCDASDAAQLKELKILGDLTKRALAAGVQVMIEGPGHVPLDEIVASMKLEKKLCHGAPFYVLGPLPTDVAPGYDHMTAAIGGSLAAASGADFLCYVTPSEHLGLPDLSDVKDGIIASRLAAHIADIVKRVPGAKEWDRKMSKARKALDWDRQIKLSIDPDKARSLRRSRTKGRTPVCSMCGEYCAMKVMSETLQ